MKYILLATIAISIIGYGCDLKFGDGIELIAPNVTSKQLNDVTGRTGIKFPEGSSGLGYVFLGSGIDDSLASKILIPNEKQSEFFKNDIFHSANKGRFSILIGYDQVW